MDLRLIGAIAVATAATALVLSAKLEAAIGWPRVRHPDGVALHDAGWRRSLREWEALRAVTIVAIALASAALDLPVAVGAVVGSCVPSVIVRGRAAAARERASVATTRIVRVVHAGLGSGLTLHEALRRAADGAADDLAAAPFNYALQRFAVGASLDASLREAAAFARDRRARVALETMALGVGERLSIERIASVVGAISERLLYDERLDEEVRARTGGIRTELWLLALLVPALTLYLALTVPSLASTLTGPVGRTVLLPGAALLEIAGIVLSRRIVGQALR